MRTNYNFLDTNKSDRIITILVHRELVAGLKQPDDSVVFVYSCRIVTYLCRIGMLQGNVQSLFCEVCRLLVNGYTYFAEWSSSTFSRYLPMVIYCSVQ